MTRIEFDMMIGRLDRLLSEVLLASKGDLDACDLQTLKHHGEDMKLAGQVLVDRVREKTKTTGA